MTMLTMKPARMLVMILFAAAMTTLDGQSARPADIHPESLSRLPPLTRGDLAAEDQRIWDYLTGVNGTMPKAGPPPVTIYSPKSAEPIQILNQYLRQSIVGPRYFELSALVASTRTPPLSGWAGHCSGSTRSARNCGQRPSNTSAARARSR